MSKQWVVIEQDEGYMVDHTESDDVAVFFVDYSECLDPDAGIPYAKDRKELLLAEGRIPDHVKDRIVKDLDKYIRGER